MEFNKRKFKQVLHFIIHRCGHLENVGKTVLYKILYFCDFDNYELREESLTGEKYVKLTKGPAPRHFDEIINELKNDSQIKEVRAKYKGFPQNKFLSIEEPGLSEITGDELQFINKEIERLSPLTATQISGLSHQDMPWQVAEDHDYLDYEQVFYRDDTLSVREYSEE